MHHHCHLFNSDLTTIFPLLILNSWNELKVCDLENFWTYKPDTFNCFHHCKTRNEQNLSLLFPTSQLTCHHLTLLVSDIQIEQLHLALDKWSVTVHYWGIAKSGCFFFPEELLHNTTATLRAFYPFHQETSNPKKNKNSTMETPCKLR